MSGTESRIRDPYYDPPAGSGPSRATPFYDGSTFHPPARQTDPAPTDSPQTGSGWAPPHGEKWTPPASSAQWNSPQPFSNDKRVAGAREMSELERNVRAQEGDLLQARLWQKGSDLSYGIGAGTISGLVSEPLQKALTRDAAAAAKLNWTSAGGTGKFLMRAFSRTALAGTALTIDESLRDVAFGPSANSWGLQSLSVPIGLTLGKGFWGKSLLVAGGIASGQALDMAVPAPDWLPESLRHFTMSDGIALSIASEIPTKTRMAKVGVMAAGWLAGNLLESATKNASAGELEEVALKSTNKDLMERTYDSMTESLQHFRELGKKNEVVLEHDHAKQLINASKSFDQTSNEGKLGASRCMIAVSAALGEHHLAAGTRLSITQTSTPTYVLEGLNLDMGGQGLMYLSESNFHIQASKLYTEKLMSVLVNNKRVTNEELKDLDRISTDVNKSINAILGKHDLTAAMQALVTFLDRGTTSNSAILNKEGAFNATFITEINKKLGDNFRNIRNSDGSLNSDAVTISAKLLRDQALAQIAMAKNYLDHENYNEAKIILMGTPQGRNQRLPGTNQAKNFDGAIQTLEQAEKLAPDNADLPELKALAQEQYDRLPEELKKR